MKRIAALLLLACLSAEALALDSFVVSDIRIDGLQRIAPGTVFTYLPVERATPSPPNGRSRPFAPCSRPASSTTCSSRARATSSW